MKEKKSYTLTKAEIQIMYLEALNNQNYSEITKYKPLIINTF